MVMKIKGLKWLPWLYSGQRQFAFPQYFKGTQRKVILDKFFETAYHVEKRRGNSSIRLKIFS
jgi:hypothetical protein|tara:strand:- start:412 stop:597 length:186 start_codon:yes stop_codon:yes gene_type:complete